MWAMDEPMGDATPREQIRSIFDLVADDQVRRFLLGGNPADDLQMLTMPMQSMHSISGEHEFTLTKHDLAASEPRKRSRWLLMPAFNVGARAAGLFIQHKDSGMHFVRFVRNDATGEVLYITDILHTGCTEVMLNIQHSATRRSASYLRFGTDAFRRAFGPACARNADRVSVLTEALLTACHIEEARPCPLCGTPSEMPCTCGLPLRAPRHALDFSYYPANSTHMFGSYRGRMTLSTYRQGLERSCQVYAVENDTASTPPGVTQTLLQWAVQSRLALGPAARSLPRPAADPPAPAIAIVADEEAHPAKADAGMSEACYELLSFVDRLEEPGGDVTPPGLDEAGSPTTDELSLPDAFVATALALPGIAPLPMAAVDAAAMVAARASGAPMLLPRREAGSSVSPATSRATDAMTDSDRRKIKKRMAAEKSNNARAERNREIKEERRRLDAEVDRLEKRKKELEVENAGLREQAAAMGLLT